MNADRLESQGVFLNCTLKKSPEESNTDALIKVVADVMKPLGVECETVRLADYKIVYCTESDIGDGDQWPMICEKIKAADIPVPSMPIWMGVRSSLCQLMCERLDGSYRDMNPETEQYPLYSNSGLDENTLERAETTRRSWQYAK